MKVPKHALLFTGRYGYRCA